MKSVDNAFVALGAVLVATLGGLLLWARDAKRSAMASDDPTLPLQPVLMWPGLKVGTIVLVDATKTLMSPELRAAGQVVATVDMVLLDAASIAVSVGPPGPVVWSGTIPREAIVRILLVPPSAVLVL